MCISYRYKSSQWRKETPDLQFPQFYSQNGYCFSQTHLVIFAEYNILSAVESGSSVSIMVNSTMGWLDMCIIGKLFG
jgi:hypothetical protein